MPHHLLIKAKLPLEPVIQEAEVHQEEVIVVKEEEVAVDKEEEVVVDKGAVVGGQAVKLDEILEVLVQQLAVVLILELLVPMVQIIRQQQHPHKSVLTRG